MLALLGLLAMLLSDAFHSSTPHSHIAALPVIAIGLALIFYQLGKTGRKRDKLKGILLGSAFVLWGLEPLLPSGLWVVGLDNIVIIIFVVDVTLIIWDGSQT